MTNDKPIKEVKRAPKRPTAPGPIRITKSLTLRSTQMVGYSQTLAGLDGQLARALARAERSGGAKGRKLHAAKLDELNQLIKLQITEAQERVGAIQRAAEAARQQGAFDGYRKGEVVKRVDVSTPAGMGLTQLVCAVDDVLVGYEVLWMLGLLTDAERTEKSRKLMARANVAKAGVEKVIESIDAAAKADSERFRQLALLKNQQQAQAPAAQPQSATDTTDNKCNRALKTATATDTATPSNNQITE